MSEEKKVLEELEKAIVNADIPEQEKNKLLQNYLHLKDQKVNLMITGGTGCGKSSTIDALFGTEVAKIGVTPNPETMDIQKYELDHLILWDSPGLGDGVEADKRHARNIVRKLQEKDENGDLLIDLVLVILDGGSRDLGTSFELINKVIIPNLGKDKEKRVLVAINKCDMAMPKHWDRATSKPDDKLIEFLDEKAASVKKRIKDDTGVDVTPIYYSAGYKEEGEPQEPPYNLSKLLYFILQYTPKEKRLAYVDHINTVQTTWASNDDRQDYNQGVLDSFKETFHKCVTKGTEIGGDIGGIFGETGRAVGEAIGGFVGGVGGAVGWVVDLVKDLPKSEPNSRPPVHDGGGCYITTAVCEELGKPDDCYELTMFRGFRDNYLRHQPDGEALIQRYYDTAPAIVAKIDRQPNRGDIYRHLRTTYLEPCLRDLEAGEKEACKIRYTHMMEHLFEAQRQWEQ